MSENTSLISGSVIEVSIDLIDDPKIAMRENLDDQHLDELMASMRDIGLIQPVTLNKVNDRYEVIAGHRRTRAARLLNWVRIPAKVIEVDENTALLMRMEENLTRKDVDPVDEAAYIGEIMIMRKLDEKAAAALLHRSEAWIKQRMEIFNMPDLMKGHLKQEKYPLGTALWLYRIENENTRDYYANWAAQNGCSVAQAKRLYELTKAENFNIAPGAEQVVVGEGPQQRTRTVTKCGICWEQVYVDEADSIFVHPDCPKKLERG